MAGSYRRPPLGSTFDPTLCRVACAHPPGLPQSRIREWRVGSRPRQTLGRALDHVLSRAPGSSARTDLQERYVRRYIRCVESTGRRSQGLKAETLRALKAQMAGGQAYRRTRETPERGRASLSALLLGFLVGGVSCIQPSLLNRQECQSCTFLCARELALDLVSRKYSSPNTDTIIIGVDPADPPFQFYYIVVDRVPEAHDGQIWRTVSVLPDIAESAPFEGRIAIRAYPDTGSRYQHIAHAGTCPIDPSKCKVRGEHEYE